MLAKDLYYCSEPQPGRCDYKGKVSAACSIAGDSCMYLVTSLVDNGSIRNKVCGAIESKCAAARGRVTNVFLGLLTYDTALRVLPAPSPIENDGAATRPPGLYTVWQNREIYLVYVPHEFGGGRLAPIIQVPVHRVDTLTDEDIIAYSVDDAEDEVNEPPRSGRRRIRLVR